MNQRRYLVILSMVAFALVCTNPMSAEDFPKGKFTNKGPDGAAWAIDFDGKGKATVYREDKEFVKVEYKTTKDEISFSHETGDNADKDAKPGTYKWKLDGKKLTFTKIKDDSDGRTQALTTGSWEKKE